MAPGRIILSEQKLNLVLDRLTHQLIEHHGHFENTCIVGIQPRGIALADRIVSRLETLGGISGIKYGKLDITFHRDDFRTRNEPLKASPTHMDFLVHNKTVILVDDVLYTGRTVRAALDEIADFGRPRRVLLAVLVDRGGRELPIAADVTGLMVATTPDDRVMVSVSELDEIDAVDLVRGEAT